MKRPKLVKTTYTYHTTCPECDAEIEMTITNYEGEPSHIWAYSCESCGTVEFLLKGQET